MNAAAKASDGEERSELESLPVLVGTSFGGLVGMNIVPEGDSANCSRFRLIGAQPCGRVTCVGISPENTVRNVGQSEEWEQQSQCMLGLAGGAVAWVNKGGIRAICQCLKWGQLKGWHSSFSVGGHLCCSRPFGRTLRFRVATIPIKILVGNQCLEASLADYRKGNADTPTGADVVQRAVWAAVCSNGQVTFLIEPQEHEVEATTNGNNGRIKLTSSVQQGRQRSSAPVNIPEACGCWLDQCPQSWHKLQEHESRTTGHGMAVFGVFALGFVTTAFGGTQNGIAFFTPQLEGTRSSPNSQICYSKLSVAPLCLASRGPLIAVGTASGAILLFRTEVLISTSCTYFSAFAAAATARPLASVRPASFPIQRVQFLCKNGDIREDAEEAGQFHIEKSSLYLLALGLDGSLHEVKLQNESLQSTPSHLQNADGKTNCYTAPVVQRVPAAASPPLIISADNHQCRSTPLLVIAHAKGGPTTVVTLWESGIIQMWMLAESASISDVGQGMQANPRMCPVTLELRCVLSSTSSLRDADKNVGLHGDPGEKHTAHTMSRQKSHTLVTRLKSLAPDVYAQREDLIKRKKDIQEELKALVDRVAENTACRSVETEAGQVDEDVRLLIKHQSNTILKEKKQELLVLQYAFAAFHRQLMEHLYSIIVTPPKELRVAAEKPGDTITTQNYFILEQKPTDRAIAKKFLFLRYSKWLVTWGFLVCEPLAGVLLLIPFGTCLYDVENESPAAPGPVTQASPYARGYNVANHRSAIYLDEPLKSLTNMLQNPSLLTANSARRSQFWILREVSAEVGKKQRAIKASGRCMWQTVCSCSFRHTAHHLQDVTAYNLEHMLI
ncbi:uncharacterized protein LOC34621621 [Cyclospora cayetanensis]|uniref:Uncharacterized protein LOC34621621 n=1 Tax=Cyclospora cayetanensis TaxID=88456 RepID=A0A6P6RW84_9EIME|nr:uncharacterized protein LOC34621621 [Cyclospora cayetanensis]